MDASAAFHRCVYRAFAQSKRCPQLSLRAQRSMQPQSHTTAANAARCFSSSSTISAQPPHNAVAPNSKVLPGRELFDTLEATQQKQEAEAAGKTKNELATERQAARPIATTEERVQRATSLPNNMRVGDPEAATGPTSSPSPGSGSKARSADSSAWAMLEDLGLPRSPRRTSNTSGLTLRSGTPPLNPLDFLPPRSTQSRSGPPTGNQLMQDITNMLTPLHEQVEVSYPTLRLTPALGRSVAVDHMRNIDLTRAFRMMESKCSANSIRQDERKQEKHVRKGKQKKVDRMMRWRKLFKEGYLAECARVRRMRKQGW